MKFTPRVDYAFKKLFGSEENKPLLKSLVNSVLPPDEKLSEVILINPYNDKNSPKDKSSVLDIKAKDEKGRYYNIEMQISNEVHYSKRALYYWSKLYSSQLKAGDDYRLLQKTISIHILNFDCFEKEKDYHNVFHLLNVKSHQQHFEDLALHFIELQKFTKTEHALDDRLDYWTSFLATVEKYERDTLPEVFKKDPDLNAAFEALERLHFDPQEEEVYEGQLKILRDRRGAIHSAHHRGFVRGKQEGIELGKQEGIELGKQEGIELGKQEGALYGERQVLIRLIKQKLGDIPPQFLSIIETADADKLFVLSERILNVSTFDELFKNN